MLLGGQADENTEVAPGVADVASRGDLDRSHFDKTGKIEAHLP